MLPSCMLSVTGLILPDTRRSRKRSTWKQCKRR
nr:MAG TPA: hypothetical protein [Bacteriophage sp.]